MCIDHVAMNRTYNICCIKINTNRYLKPFRYDGPPSKNATVERDAVSKVYMRTIFGEFYSLRLDKCLTNIWQTVSCFGSTSPKRKFIFKTRKIYNLSDYNRERVRGYQNNIGAVGPKSSSRLTRLNYSAKEKKRKNEPETLRACSFVVPFNIRSRNSERTRTCFLFAYHWVLIPTVNATVVAPVRRPRLGAQGPELREISFPTFPLGHSSRELHHLCGQ